MKERIYMNRELSWLKFNERVLEEAENPKVPLCERLTFASIYQSNLDEFFMVRVGTLVDQALLDEDMRDSKTNMTPMEQISAIKERVKVLNERKDVVYASLMKELQNYGINLVDFKNISKEEEEKLEKYFDMEIASIISPTIVGKRQPFPFLRNKEVYAIAVLKTKNGKERIGIIPFGAGLFENFIEVPGRGDYILLEQLMLHFVSRVFKGYEIKAKGLIRTTRNADVDADALYEEDIDYRDFMVELIKKRKKLAPIRVEVFGKLADEDITKICDQMKLSTDCVFKSKTPLDLSFVFKIQDILRKVPELFYNKRTPQKTNVFESKCPILDQIREKDKLLSYPYESMRPFLDMLHEAANDDDVISIKMTLYRVAKQSKIVEALIDAAENGKEVTVMVELKARFDEENNIEWSRRLEDAGCRVIYGLDGYKVHSKLCLITKKSGRQIEYYTQIGTGNYNEKTARLYTDLSLMTANVEIGIEANKVFQALAMGDTVDSVDHLLVAPKCLQNKVIAMIEEQIGLAKAGKPAYIGLKMNSLTDKKIMEKLVKASKAGVKIDMVIRGICCLIPGVPGKTENIRVRSIVGRFLEHSRIYIFGSKGREKVYIASADFMTRNTVKRVEVATPVEDKDLKARLINMFEVMLSDNLKARELYADGVYRYAKSTKPAINAQEYFYEEAYKRASGEWIANDYAVKEENCDKAKEEVAVTAEPAAQNAVEEIAVKETAMSEETVVESVEKEALEETVETTVSEFIIEENDSAVEESSQEVKEEKTEAAEQELQKKVKSKNSRKENELKK